MRPTPVNSAFKKELRGSTSSHQQEALELPVIFPVGDRWVTAKLSGCGAGRGGGKGRRREWAGPQP